MPRVVEHTGSARMVETTFVERLVTDVTYANPVIVAEIGSGLETFGGDVLETFGGDVIDFF